MSDHDRRLRLEQLFHEALDLTDEERGAFIDDACGGDDDLRRELEELLAADAESTHEGLLSPLQKIVPDQPTQLGRYQVLRLLGSGGMGEVYLAQQVEPVRRQVALKVVRQASASPQVLTRFDAERQALAMMNHDNVARVLDAGAAEDGRPYFVMEYVGGPPLTDYCHEHRLDLEARLRLFIQVCRGVQHAHQNGIVHRDLKASNLLVETQGGDAVPKIIDFGIAKALDEPLTDVTLETIAGYVLGTPGYMSPEQAEPEGVIDTRTDVYALGVVLYELLVGSRPFDEGHVPLTELLHRIRHEDPPRPSLRLEASSPDDAGWEARHASTVVKRLRSDLDWLILRALEKDPARRYASASELASDVERFLREEPLDAGPPTTLYLTRKFARKHRVAVAAISAVMMALISGLSLAIWQFLEARDNLELADERLVDYGRMADARRVADLERRAEGFGAAWPDAIQDFEDWLTRSNELEDRRKVHERRISELDQLLKAGGSGDTGGTEYDPDELAWQRETLQDLLDRLAAVRDLDNPASPQSRAKHLLASAESLATRSPDIDRDAWDDAIESIANEEECPDYDSLTIQPQTGLVPLGRNLESGLWEFWHIQSGEKPGWDEEEVWMDEESGIVLVLIPAGTWTVGAKPRPPGTKPGPYLDPWAATYEGPPMEVTLDPFFISKFELTQSQWQRWNGANPSRYHEPSDDPRCDFNGAHPVESVDWVDCERTVREMGLTLPTEVQWEVAARARTTSVFHFGHESTDLFDHGANIADEASKYFFTGEWRHEPRLDDGFAGHAPVGSTPPNPFGLHGIHGNVSEWCRDIASSFSSPLQPGDALRDAGDQPGETRIYRGGNFNCIVPLCRIAGRYEQNPDVARPNIGVRPARRLEAR